MPYLVDYDSVKAMATRVVDHARTHPQYLISVVTANNESQNCMQVHLEPLCRSNGIPFRMYRSTHRTRVDFGRPGILLVNQQSLKGLEFDSVIVADLHAHFVRRNSLMHKKVLYVTTSRARERLYIFYERNRSCPVLAEMPGPEILKRYTVSGNEVKA